MALVPYALTRPFLFGMDPEAAHELTLNTLARTQHSMLNRAYRSTRISDPIELAGLKFPNRVGLAAGLDKNARCIDGLGAMGFGFVEVGTVTPLAQSGNPKPRMFRLPKAMGLINRLGFNNDGLDAFIANVQQSRLYQQRCAHPDESPTMLLGLNIGKNAATPIERATDDYLICLDGVYPYADYVTVNISSPNTKNLRTLQNDDALDALLAAISKRREELAQIHGKRVPIFLKIAPDLDDEQIAVIAQTLQRYGKDTQGKVNNAWGVIATNTTLSRAPVLTMSNRVISQLRASLGPEFPIIGVGGIMSAQDAVSKIRAGANVVQIYSGLIYQGPELVSEAATLIKNTF
ncbi:MAG: dihydroorotate dehydrogenase (fumarate) [Comamonadaceae bacterium]|nr:MAG: dihydroorotate dehydrogenase (fumarate) [Comamonadaceae bacterium]